MEVFFVIVGGIVVVGVLEQYLFLPMRTLTERVEELELDKEELGKLIDEMDSTIQSLDYEISKIKDPVYYRALEEGDGQLLYELDQARKDESTD